MEIYTFPRSLREGAELDTTAHISFEIIAKNDPEAFAKVHLFTPNGVSAPDAATYNQMNLGLLGAGLALTAGKETLKEFQKGGVKGIGQTGMATLLATGVGGNKAAAAGIQMGVAANPYIATAFESTTLRSFGFTFKCVPESSEEAEDVRMIENLFRKFMYPKELDPIALQYPPIFRIKFYNGEEENKFMPMILDSYLINLTTTYNETSNMFHGDGAPVETSMSITFQETKALTRDDLYGEDLEYRRERPSTDSAQGEGE